MTNEKQWKIGELARRTGITIRTLHHYDEIGLLRPAARSASNYRLYSAEDLIRLQQIVSLRQVGLSLEEIGALLDRPGVQPLEAIERHLARVREQIEAARALHERLERIAAAMRAAETVSPEDLFQTMEMTIMFEKYYTPEQLRQLEARREQVGEARISEVEAEWPRLMEEVRQEMERGTDPADPRVQALARRWRGLVEEFTGGDPGISASLNRMYSEESEVHGMQVGPMREMGEYIRRAQEASAD